MALCISCGCREICVPFRDVRRAGFVPTAQHATQQPITKVRSIACSNIQKRVCRVECRERELAEDQYVLLSLDSRSSLN